ncbi:hypothetical protein TNCV_2187611 [Trichonephila clavipes]|nr:hypothetical protein TNCV_2187611 [Trichonephila clavipes]
MEHFRYLLGEVETSEQEMDQAREESDEVLDINYDSENKFEKSDEHETFESYNERRFGENEHLTKQGYKRSSATKVNWKIEENKVGCCRIRKLLLDAMGKQLEAFMKKLSTTISLCSQEAFRRFPRFSFHPNSRHVGTLIIHRAASPFVRLVEERGGWSLITHRVFSIKIETDESQIVLSPVGV